MSVKPIGRNEADIMQSTPVTQTDSIVLGF
jgi:hypothetical protein